jgi:hypothetical protein
VPSLSTFWKWTKELEQRRFWATECLLIQTRAKRNNAQYTFHTLAGFWRCRGKIMGPRPVSLRESQRARRGLRAALLLQRFNNGQVFFFLKKSMRTHSFKENCKRKWVVSRAGKKKRRLLYMKKKRKERKKNKDVNLVNFRFHVWITKLYEREIKRPSSQARRTQERSGPSPTFHLLAWG